MTRFVAAKFRPLLCAFLVSNAFGEKFLVPLTNEFQFAEHRMQYFKRRKKNPLKMAKLKIVAQSAVLRFREPYLQI